MEKWQFYRGFLNFQPAPGRSEPSPPLISQAEIAK
jgi:hypothetical protein